MRRIKMDKITQEMIENWLGSDTDIPELLAELANGDYKAEEFYHDVKGTWEHDGVIKEINDD
jgi:hypothetical protein